MRAASATKATASPICAGIGWGLALAAVPTLSGFAQTTPSPATSSDRAAGRMAFVEIGCYQCHGYVGQGGLSTGPALVPHLLPFEGLRAYVRHPSGQMPPFSERVLGDARLRQIYAYLASLPPPMPPSQ